MASNKIKGITVEIGGDTTKLGKALDDSEKHSRSLQKELKDVNTLLKFDGNNAELLAQKQRILTEAVSETSKKLNTLKEAEAQVVAQFERGEIGEDKLRAFQREVIATESSLDQLNAELKSMESAVGSFESETDGAVSALDKLTDTVKDQESKLSQLKREYSNVVLEQGESSDEAKRLASEISSLNDDLNENKQKLTEASKSADKLTESFEDTGDSANKADGGFTIMKGALADLVANVIAGAISKIGELVGALFELSEATEEYRTMQAKLSGSAETFGYSADFAKSKYEEFYKYLGDDQMSTNAVTNLMGIGAETETVSKLAEGATAVWASYGDSIPIEGLTEAINETVQCGKVTGTFADTINWAKDANTNLNSALSGNKEAQKAFNDALKEGLPVEDAFNEALAKITDEQERADVVAQFLNSTYGESKTTYDELNKSVTDANEAELALKDTQAELGETMAPVNTAFTNFKNEALNAITPLVKKLADAFLNLISWLQEHPAILKIITALAIALATAFGVLAGALAIQGLITGVQKAFALLNSTLLANPITLIVALIAGLVTAFIYLWNNCEGFRNFWIGLWDKIKSVFNTVCDVIVKFFTETIPNAFNNFKAKVSEIVTTVVDKIVNFFTVTIPEAFNEFKTALTTKVTEAFTAVKTFFTQTIPGIITDVVNWFKELPGKIWTAIIGVVDKVAQWGANVKAKATEVAKNAIDAIVNFFSELPYKIGYAIGFVIGKLVEWYNNIKTWVTTQLPIIISNIVTFFKELPGKIYNAILSTIEKIKTWGTNVYNTAKEKVTNTINSVVSFFKKLPGKIYNAITSTVSKIKTWGTNVANTAKQKITDMVNKVVSTAKTLPGKIKSAIQNAISNVSAWGSKVASTAKTKITDMVNKVVSTAKQLPSKIKNAIQGAISRVSEWCTSMKNKANDGIKKVVTTITDKLKEVPTKVKSIGKNIVEGLWQGIKNATAWIKKKVGEFAKGILDGMKESLGIKSPSRVFRDQVGKFIAEGVGAGITQNEDSALNALETMGDDMVKTARNINGITLSRQLEATFNGTVSGELGIINRLDEIVKKLEARTQIVLDTGVLVGETVDAMDTALGNKKTQIARGW